MARATHDRNDDDGHRRFAGNIVTFDEASCANPVRWASTVTEVWQCPCCGALILPDQTHHCLAGRVRKNSL
jgi:hypothetical protein